MATIAQLEEDKDKVEGAQQDAGASQPLTTTTATTGGATPAASQQSTAGASSGAKKPTSSGSFVDLGKFVDVNKNLAANATTALTEGLGTTAQTAGAGITSAADQYAENAKRHQTGTGAFAGRGLSGINQAEFGNLFKGATFDKWDQAPGIANLTKATKAIDRTNTDAGRREALKSIASQGYSRGEQDLDSILLGRQEGKTGQFGQLRDKYGSSYGAGIVEAANTRVGGARDAVNTQRGLTADAAKDYLRGQGSDLATKFGGYRTAATTTAQNNYRDMMQATYDDAVQKEKSRIAAEKTTTAQNILNSKMNSYLGGGLNKSAGTSWLPKGVAGNLDTKHRLAYGGQNFDQAMAGLSGGAFDINNLTGNVNLSAADSADLASYNALRGVAGTGSGQDINYGSNTGIDSASAQAALRNLVKMEAITKPARSEVKPISGSSGSKEVDGLFGPR